VLNTQYAAQADVVARLHSEARHSAAIRNEHIVDVFDIGATAGGRPFVVMELLQGESLAERLRRCRVLSELDTLRIGRQLATALAAAHRSGIVHRDIKPENLFLCPRDGGDFVKVLDFGISKALAPTAVSGESLVATVDPRLTRTGAVLGTPLYMSPEQVRGDPLDHRVDIYALGVVLYECLTGSVPFVATSYLGVIAKILTELPEPPSQRSPERALPAALEQIVLRAMAHDRAVRYPSMDTLLDDLERYASGRSLQPATWLTLAPTVAGSAGPVGGRRSAGSSGAGWSVGSGLPLTPILVGAGLVLTIGLVLTLWNSPSPPPVAARPPLPSRGGQVALPPSAAAAAPVAAGASSPPSAVEPSRPSPSLVPAHPHPPRPVAPVAPPAASPPSPDPLFEEQAPNPFLPSPPGPLVRRRPAPD
jgi:serine/threonine-protein kinase